ERGAAGISKEGCRGTSRGDGRAARCPRRPLRRRRGLSPLRGSGRRQPASPARPSARMRPVVAVFGPTASGKTAVAEAVAERVPAELVSADSAQVYRGLPILTNQSSRPAHLVAIWDLDREASVADYQRLAHAAIDAALAADRMPVVVGGT